VFFYTNVEIIYDIIIYYITLLYDGTFSKNHIGRGDWIVCSMYDFYWNCVEPSERHADMATHFIRVPRLLGARYKRGVRQYTQIGVMSGHGYEFNHGF
jgi:hypothetical protein